MNPFLWRVRVYYEDTDAAGVVYYANYLRYLERARTEWLRALGLGQERLRREAGVLFAVRSAELHFDAPARLDDELAVSVAVAERGGASLTFAQAIERVSPPGRVVRARVRVACLDAERLRPRRLPPALIRELMK
ncbi:tol-pal system-associated acyl-CoA thioesterase [Inmirania thermothiophila]|uniref:Acyl-CoA thioester hydrolase n=1 Tax=Inmirania thermothiophila TaxID=1750597 RepID=A0A3N1XT37_9GAMM|nr:tol-pal system-associated acyl-CoA thioesterase [Inmirania thermothiophila]ROR29799.1 acyl-CoA thioester hydrolase [Inmirania thermothiophila]